MNELVFKGQNDQVLTNSLLIAEKFGKEHQHVLRDIRTLIEGMSEIGDTPMFVESTYINEQNKQEYPIFIMNRDGFTLLTMGFNGKKDLKFKIEYIAAFNAMEKALKEQQNKKLSGAEFLLEQAKLMVEQERRLSNVENEIAAMKKEREENGKLLLSLSLSPEVIPQLSIRDNIRQLVNIYAEATNTSTRDVYHKIYNQLYYLYHISINNYKKVRRDESKLEIAERNHFLDKVFNIASNLVREANISC